jgi:hypothetical protein
MANTNKTKAEILQELESIKGLLLEADDIPILSDMEDSTASIMDLDEPVPLQLEQPQQPQQNSSALPGQASLFEEPQSAINNIEQHFHHHEAEAQTRAAELLNEEPDSETDPEPTEPEFKTEPQKHGFASHLTQPHPHHPPRPLAKASGENPFLPQHIRERLHGNNPPPLFEYETAKKILNSTKNIAHKINQPRQHLIDEVVHNMMPQIEAEVRHRLFAMSVEDLEKLLHEDAD